MDQLSLPCSTANCAFPAHHVAVVGTDRLLLYCDQHVLVLLHRPEVQLIFPTVAWAFASRLPTFQSTAVSEYLFVRETIKRIESAAEAAASQRGRVATTGSDSESNSLHYIKALLRQNLAEADNVGIADWRNCREIVNCKALYENYVPVLVPRGSENIAQYAEDVSLKCKTLSTLLTTVRWVKGVRGRFGYYEKRALERMLTALRELAESLRRDNVDFVTVGEGIVVSVNRLVETEIVDVLREVQRTVSLVVEPAPIDIHFHEEIAQKWSLLIDACLSLRSAESAASANLSLGDSFRHTHNYTAAQQSYELALDSWGSSQTSDPRLYTQARTKLAVVSFEMGQVEAAREHFHEASPLLEDSLEHSDLAEAYLCKGQIDAHLLMYDSALENFQKSETHLRSDPSPAPLSVSIHYQIGEVYRRTHRLSAAAEHFQLAKTQLTVANSPQEKSAVYTALGQVLHDLGQIAEAMENFRVAIQNLPPSDPAFPQITQRILAAGGRV